MVGRKRRGSILFILSMLMVMLCGFGMMNVEVQAEVEVPPFQKYVLEEIGEGYYKLTINYQEGDTSTAVKDCTCASSRCNLSNHITEYEKVKKVEIQNGITTIDKSAFKQWPELESVVLPNTVTIIKDYAFYNTPLQQVFIPGSVKEIGKSAFSCCKSLTSVTFEYGTCELIIGPSAFLGCSEITSITIPGRQGGTHIKNNMFNGCKKLENITLESGVVEIENDVFDDTAIKTITIPETVTTLNTMHMFSGCKNLTEVDFQCAWDTIGEQMFMGCSSLEEFEIPSTIKFIEREAFNGCGIKELEIPATVTSIGAGAFNGCGIKELKIPESVTSIGAEAFGYCSDLNTIYMNPQPENISFGDEIFSDSYTTIYMLVPVGTVEAYVNKTAGGDFWYGVNQHYIWENIPHEHSLNYQVEDQTIKAWCTKEHRFNICTCYGNISNAKEITLSATDVDFDGISTTNADVVLEEGFPIEKSSIEIKHYDSEDTLLLAPPTQVGEYKAKVTLGTATAEVSYKITHEHDPEGMPATAATCMQDGYIAYFKCKNQACGEIFMDEDCTIPAIDIVDPMKGHDMSEATCTAEPKCKREGCNYTEGNSLGHTYGDAVFNWAADYSTATATCTCQNDSSHVLSAQCTVTSEVIKEATATENGKMAYTATVDLNLNTYTDVKMVETPMLESDTPGGNTPGGNTPGGNTPGGETPGGNTPGTDTPGGDTPSGETPGGNTPGTETPDGDDDEYIDYDDVDMEKDDVLDDANTITLNEKLKVTQTGSQFNVKWGRIKQADGYDIYVQRCGKNFKSKPTKTVKGNKKTSIKVKKLDGKKINLTKSYKVRVIAYKYVDGKKVVLAKSLTAHVVGRKNKKYTNVKSVKVEKSKYTIKVGKTKKIKASVKLEEKGKKQISTSHTAHFRYVSSDKSVATVSKNGKIKAVGKGTCDVYVYGKNGCGKKIKVTVK